MDKERGKVPNVPNNLIHTGALELIPLHAQRLPPGHLVMADGTQKTTLKIEQGHLKVRMENSERVQQKVVARIDARSSMEADLGESEYESSRVNGTGLEDSQGQFRTSRRIPIEDDDIHEEESRTYIPNPPTDTNVSDAAP
ncbi:hypothetical protein PRZ48_002711 [Zasmidium cellare]|uniref:Uncharacterized protein n=1 Tax=Zasmidium cellare TaxID=395010 RepID=A0ABR0ETM1_ZASCE|nr:hypothetical protein PRZ48_002711 [Zasmidium cellare]